MPVWACRRQGQQLHPTGVSSQVCQSWIARGNFMFWPAQVVALPDMVHGTDVIKSGVLSYLRDLDQCGAKLTRATGPGEIVEMQSQFHDPFFLSLCFDTDRHQEDWIARRVTYRPAA